tara:strand:+ start:2807 stop:3346 length:540 start_codon:yes stop_codon:yes gene_type:complete
MNNTIKTYNYSFSSFAPVDGRHHFLRNFRGDGRIFTGIGAKTRLIQTLISLFGEKADEFGLPLNRDEVVELSIELNKFNHEELHNAKNLLHTLGMDNQYKKFFDDEGNELPPTILGGKESVIIKPNFDEAWRNLHFLLFGLNWKVTLYYDLSLIDLVNIANQKDSLAFRLDYIELEDSW